MEYLPFQESDHIDDEGTFVTAPTSPIIIIIAAADTTAAAAKEEEEPSMALFYSLPSSPMRRTIHLNPSSFITDDDFEFETSKKFRLESEELEKTLSFIQQQNTNTNNMKKKNLSLVLPEMTSADELFSNGFVTASSPLKLPPGRTPAKTANSSPCSSFSEMGNPSCLGGAVSPWRHTWKDGFDPFAAAIQKIVKEEVKKKESTDVDGNSTRVHRRAHSLCIPPSLILPHPPLIGSKSGLKEKRHERTESDHHHHHNPHSLRRYQTGLHNQCPSPSSPDSELNNNQKGIIVNGPPNGLNWRVTSRKHRMGKFLRRYATFKVEKNEGKIKEQIASLWRSSSFKRMSLRFKENKHNYNSNNNNNQDHKKVGDDKKMTIPNYQPKFATCLGYRGGKTSPT